MSLRPKHVKLIGAAGAAALTVGAIASPALAAGEETADTAYTCVTGLGNASVAASWAVDQPPASMVAGQTSKLGTTVTLTLDAATTQLAQNGLMWDHFNGSITTTPTGNRVGNNITIPMTTLGNSSGSTVSNATGKTLVKPTAAGTYTLKLGNLGLVTLNGFDASNASLGTVTFPNGDGSIGPCNNNAGSTTLANASAQPATVSVSKDKSKTATTAKYVGKKHVAKGTAKVKGAKFGLPGTGKVKFILKKGTHTVKTLKGKLNKKGIASVSFKNVTKKGKYSITAKFGGDKALKSSSGKDTFKV